MPELPEVETIVRHLRPVVAGKKIVGLWSDTPRLFRGGKKIDEIKKEILNKKIISVERAGKNIVFKLDDNFNLIIHLMMTGKLLFNPRQQEKKFIRFFMELGGENILALHDVRKFGRVDLIKQNEFQQKINIGPDALLTSKKNFKKILKNRKSAIKSILLNQSQISGIGNIYADEILWQAGIHPLRGANSLTDQEQNLLLKSLRHILKKAIKKEGTSSRDYRKPDGTEGGYYNIRKAYQREGEGCERDQGIISRIIVVRRSTYFCPKHQK